MHIRETPRPLRIEILRCLPGITIFIFLATIAYLDIFTSQKLQNSNIHTREFPKRLWQTSHIRSISAYDWQLRDSVDSWAGLNPEYRYELLTYATSQAYVHETFPNQPNIIRTFINIQSSILRSNLVRFLALLAEGGVYSDIDTRALKPISSWIPDEHEAHTNMVLGLEVDDDSPEALRLYGSLWPNPFLFCGSTIMSKPGHPILEEMVEGILSRISALAVREGSNIADLKLRYEDIESISGLAVFTEAVFQYLSSVTGTQVSKANFTGITEPKRIADVLVMPINAFASGKAHSNSGSAQDPTALVQHFFEDVREESELEEEADFWDDVVSENIDLLEDEDEEGACYVEVVGVEEVAIDAEGEPILLDDLKLLPDSTDATPDGDLDSEVDQVSKYSNDGNSESVEDLSAYISDSGTPGDDIKIMEEL